MTFVRIAGRRINLDAVAYLTDTDEGCRIFFTAAGHHTRDLSLERIDIPEGAAKRLRELLDANCVLSIDDDGQRLPREAAHVGPDPRQGPGPEKGGRGG